jgi:hypothetical protein
VVSHQIVKSIHGLDLAGIHPNNPIATRKNPELVSSKNTALVLEETQNSIIKDVATDVSINGTKGVVHENDIGIKVNGSRNVETLLLATRDCDTTLTNFGKITMWKHVQISLKSTSKYSSEKLASVNS